MPSKRRDNSGTFRELIQNNTTNFLSEFISNNKDTFRDILPNKALFVRVHMNQYRHFQSFTTRRYFFRVISRNKLSRSYYKIILHILPNKALFVRVHMSQYWHFQSINTKQYYTHFSEFISRNKVSRSYYKLVLHIFGEFISNNIDTYRFTTKEFYNTTFQTKVKFWESYWQILHSFSTEIVPDNTSFSLAQIWTCSKSLWTEICAKSTFRTIFDFKK